MFFCRIKRQLTPDGCNPHEDAGAIMLFALNRTASAVQNSVTYMWLSKIRRHECAEAARAQVFCYHRSIIFEKGEICSLSKAFTQDAKERLNSRHYWVSHYHFSLHSMPSVWCFLPGKRYTRRFFTPSEAIHRWVVRREQSLGTVLDDEAFRTETIALAVRKYRGDKHAGLHRSADVGPLFNLRDVFGEEVQQNQSKDSRVRALQDNSPFLTFATPPYPRVQNQHSR